jgi:hypothetical protein
VGREIKDARDTRERPGANRMGGFAAMVVIAAA